MAGEAQGLSASEGMKEKLALFRLMIAGFAAAASSAERLG